MNTNSLCYEDLYDHQKKYYDALRAQTGTFKSLVCIPTGGGKTRLAATYLLNERLAKGDKILWIAHSQFLLDQAYDVFVNSTQLNTQIICVHSNAEKFSALRSDHRIVIISFQSLIANGSSWQEILGDNVTIVIDEAHHLVAPSYLNAIKSFAENKCVIGLTATPVRSKWEENNELCKYFSTDLNIKIHMAELFKLGVLVKPTFEDVYFNLEVSKQSDLSTLVHSLTNSSNYHDLILDQYLQNKERYGKTVIFALNIVHANLLYQMFKAAGIETYLVHSRAYNRDSDFPAFKRSVSGVLININIMNEGVDVPNIQTVFMTKPLNSRIAVTQIIGRALRSAPNKTQANIVNFAVSNVGRKLLLVTPNLTYKFYECEWDRDGDDDTDIEDFQALTAKIAEHLELATPENVVCSFSHIFVVGYFKCLGDDSTDLLFPVTFEEYVKIQKYRTDKKQFPKRMFFVGNPEMLQQVFHSNAEITFTAYDQALLDALSQITANVRQLYAKIKQSRRMTLNDRTSEIQSLFSDLNPDIKSYLNQVSRNSFKAFHTLILSELNSIKYEKE